MIWKIKTIWTPTEQCNTHSIAIKCVFTRIHCNWRACMYIFTEDFSQNVVLKWTSFKIMAIWMLAVAIYTSILKYGAVSNYVGSTGMTNCFSEQLHNDDRKLFIFLKEKKDINTMPDMLLCIPRPFTFIIFNIERYLLCLPAFPLSKQIMPKLHFQA